MPCDLPWVGVPSGCLLGLWAASATTSPGPHGENRQSAIDATRQRHNLFVSREHRTRRRLHQTSSNVTMLARMTVQSPLKTDGSICHTTFMRGLTSISLIHQSCCQTDRERNPSIISHSRSASPLAFGTSQVAILFPLRSSPGIHRSLFVQIILDIPLESLNLPSESTYSRRSKYICTL